MMDLLTAARSVREQAYAPYSLFRVGVALRAVSGKIYVGANVENAAYPQGQCAEASAIGQMIAHGEKEIAELLVFAHGHDICSPCGGCRQRIREFATPNTIIYLANPAGIQQQLKFQDLLPLSFGPDIMNGKSGKPHPAIALMDLTSLNDDDTPEKIQALCKRAVTPLGPVAAVCVFPRFLTTAKTTLPFSMIRLATVINFPKGNSEQDAIIQNTINALQDGAEEIDLVIPYHLYLAKSSLAARQKNQKLVAAVKEKCGPGRLLKVILETGMLQETALIESAAQDCVDAGADFLKTSTGKTPIGATLSAVETLLKIIRKTFEKDNRMLGCKVSGGVRTAQDADAYFKLAERVMGKGWANPATFRFGASSLLDHLLSLPPKPTAGDY